MKRYVALLTLCASLVVARPLRADDPIYAINAGGQAYTDTQGIVFDNDRSYDSSGSGYVGGYYISPAYAGYSAGWSCHDPQLHEKQRGGMTAYRFDLPPGDYILRLYWLEGVFHGPRLRVMDVRVEGVLLFDDLDIAELTGFMEAWELSRLVTVADGTLDVEFEVVRGGSTISALAVWEAVDPGQAPLPVSGFDLRDSYGMNILRWDGSFDYTLQDVLVYRATDLGGPYELHDSVPYGRERYYDWAALGGNDYFYYLSATDVWGREGNPCPTANSTALHWSQSTLPVFHLDMTQADYDSLNSYPMSDNYWPANWAVDNGILYSIEARYRGGMARYFQKKSWKLELSGALNYGGWQDLFLISNPDDNYLILNDVSLRIFDYLLPWSSESEFVHLQFENEYWGVYELVEKVDDEFLLARGVTNVGNLYKAKADFHAYSNDLIYEIYYPQKAGPDSDHADLIEFIEGVDEADEYELGPFLGARLDLENFWEYYAMMIYTRQVDFIVRNYYLYHDWDSGLWSLIPWDMNICFHWDALPLDFGTSTSPHFWDGSWNRLYDAVLSVPRLRWGYAKRLEELNATVLNRDYLEPLVNGIYDSIEFDALRDTYKAHYDDNSYFVEADNLTTYRMGQRDEQLLTMLPEFMSEIPTVCINEHQSWVGGASGTGGRNEFSPWMELYNFGDDPVFLGSLELTVNGTPGSGENLPSLFLKPDVPRLIYLDGRPDLGALHMSLQPDSAGGTWVLVDQQGDVWDRVRYGPTSGLISEGRQPDGWVSWNRMPMTPHRVNSLYQPPIVSSASITPSQPLASDTLHVLAEAADPQGRSLVLTFFWTLNGSEVKSRHLLPDDVEGQWTGTLAPRMQGGLLEWWVEARSDLDIAGYDPPGAPLYRNETLLLDDSLPLYLNEFMADNVSTIADEYSGYDDWVEIYNAGEAAIDLAGFTLTDDLSLPGTWSFPADTATVLAPGGFLLVWADDEAWQGPLHASFKLSANGEELGLFLADGTPIDFLVFGPQIADVSYGRVTDGGEPWDFLPVATPGSSNEGGPLPDETPGDGSAPALGAWPNPFNPQLRLQLYNPEAGTVRLEILDLRGRLVERLCATELPAGPHEIVWRGTNGDGRRVASGIYFARLEAGGTVLTKKILLLK